MHMIRGYGAFDDIDVLPLTQFHQDLFEPGLDSFDQYLIPIFWYPYKVILTPIYRV
jgi:hypothetical protein